MNIRRNLVRKNGLTPREKEFCRNYVSTGEAVEAAQAAGYKKASLRYAQELLSREDVAQEIARLCVIRRQTAAELARVGYQRLAFGSISHAVSLLYMDNPTREELDKMDLFCVSEIKRPKDGSMEIKFFDRLKALEKLQCGAQNEGGAAPIYDAIAMGARALGGQEVQDEV